MIVVLFAPTIIFYHDIEFDKLLFINNWLTSIGQGLIIAALIHLIIANHSRTIQKEEDNNAILNIVVILNEIATIIKTKSNINTEDMKNRINNIENIRLLIHDEKIKTKINEIYMEKEFMKFKSMATTTKEYEDNRYITNILNEIIEQIKQISNRN